MLSFDRQCQELSLDSWIRPNKIVTTSMLSILAFKAILAGLLIFIVAWLLWPTLERL
jgi:hypothetical protein